MRNVVGIVNLHDGPSLGNLTEKRPLGAVTFLGRYGLMDFALSNLSNSGIDRICIFAEKNVQAIRSHMGSGSIWINNTVTGFVRFFANEKEMNSKHFNTDVNSILANSSQLDGLDCDYVVVVPPFMLMSIDFREVVEAHKKSGADATIVYTHALEADKTYQNCEEILFNENNEIQHISPFSGNKGVADISLQTYVFNKSALQKLVAEGHNVSALYNIRQMLAFFINRNLLKVNAYRFDGYVAPIISLNHYIWYSFELLSYSKRSQLFLEDWPIYTTTHNTPPSLYSSTADVQNSFIANGSIIKGKVHNSILSREVVVEEGAVVENCILFTKTKVGPGVHTNYVVADKSVKITEKKEVCGDINDYLCILTGEKI
ncbi:MAG: glucose-1-phosphate adenylyltransferase subunit GlgD [Bacilli bacterium]|nr:glucose-1-phosphate adenylyltransferase subunit GlgD [Bacilli bacterium]